MHSEWSLWFHNTESSTPLDLTTATGISAGEEEPRGAGNRGGLESIGLGTRNEKYYKEIYEWFGEI